MNGVERLQKEIQMGKLIKSWERPMLVWSGKIIAVLGALGLVFTVVFDQVSRGESVTTWGWLQILGVIVFIALTIYGLLIDLFLNNLKEFLDKW